MELKAVVEAEEVVEVMLTPLQLIMVRMFSIHQLTQLPLT
jgi:hypothetical protein